MNELQQAYLTMHKASGIEVGDKVKVVKKAMSNKIGWNSHWSIEMNHWLGITYKVIQDRGSYGFRLGSEAGYSFPFFALEIVEKAKPPEPPVTAYGTPVEFRAGGITMTFPGALPFPMSAEFTNDNIRAIAARLIDEDDGWTNFFSKSLLSYVRTKGIKGNVIEAWDGVSWIDSPLIDPDPTRDHYRESSNWKEIPESEAPDGWVYYECSNFRRAEDYRGYWRTRGSVAEKWANGQWTVSQFTAQTYRGGTSWIRISRGDVPVQ